MKCICAGCKKEGRYFATIKDTNIDLVYCRIHEPLYYNFVKLMAGGNCGRPRRLFYRCRKPWR